MPDDALGAAMLDYLRGDYDGSCVHYDPERGETWDANVESFYFAPSEVWSASLRSLVDGLRTPVLDVGCGAGNHALVVQNRGTVVGFDASPKAVRAARERGVEHAFVADMFRMPVASDRFETAFVNGTQATLASSRAELVSVLDALARVTTATGEAVVDSYDPADADRSHGHRPTDEAGVGRRTFRVEYRGRGLVGPRLDFRTFSPGELRAACAQTAWTVGEVAYDGDAGYYRARLQK
ncbi:class I SAM-dependent methyltransferase [Halopelagius longus]|uniref:Class I SAM-dependent methyltransferase n=1 Tax=Halopelagius longus TaxID=1236180 RepID=A0A1H1B2X4_9EURY|nr:class I SAM-dependent methyltransferase [Halopelagius longus]RDI70620.1 class I SAM-dependent methyltransferase [Halopelagius longus]SDQ46295.1 Methyltransferase domain-containing protein [Halopelagius longus]